MYFFEWGSWVMKLEPEEARKDDHKLEKKLGTKRKLPYASEDDEEQADARICVSQTPKSRGPVYVFNDTSLEIRSGTLEAKRGLISIISMSIIALILIEAGLCVKSFMHLIEHLSSPKKPSYWQHIYPIIFLGTLAISKSYLYIRYGLRFSRLEIFTSRHLLIRFNRKTQQVYLHRPSYCGGIVTLPWKGVTSSGASEKTAIASGIGVPLFLYWSPRVTGTLHPEGAWVGKAGNNQAELRDEWEFIRRFMDEGPQGLPRPRITSHFPWPWQAFTPQFEGLTHYFRRASRTTKVGLLLICPAFLIIGLGHWLSLLLCWKPRWPKLIRQAGLPGKPIPPLTTLADRPPHIQERLRANAHLWTVRPGKRPEKKPRRRRGKSEVGQS
ncbi:DUF6708 domain-containing protein [Pseudomonas sp. JUb96]|uniref:DUF6708 domain-containing protein n=1 Tax=Pseudomonas sp. JUb96 TaxID=2940539 RepID=UPI00222797BD|nr:DUF6708 domain-containing protein [Pseudomonas sp. JUb96]MCW2271679.1 hypothetical protein [Pseudomonas sp. JUb96]